MNRLQPFLVRWEAILVAILIVLCVVGQIESSGALLRPFNLQSAAFNAAVVACLALGLLPVIIMGDIDLSAASIATLSGVIIAVLHQHHWSIWVAVAGGIVISLLLGVINGLLVSLLNLPALAVTLGTGTALTGAAYLILGGSTIISFPQSFTALGTGLLFGTPIPTIAVIVLLIGIVVAVVLHATRFGKSVFAIGGGREAAAFSGISIIRVRVAAFTISGFVAGIAGALYIAVYNTANANATTTLLLPAITIVVLGGVDMFGGSGNVLGVGIAVLVVGLLNSLLTILGMSGQASVIAIGSLLVLTVIGGTYLRKWLALRQRGAVAAGPPPVEPPIPPAGGGRETASESEADARIPSK